MVPILLNLTLIKDIERITVFKESSFQKVIVEPGGGFEPPYSGSAVRRLTSRLSRQ